MSVTVQKIGDQVAVGNQFYQKALVTVGIYETGGVAISANDFDFSTLDWLEITGGVILGSPYTGIAVAQWDRDNKKVLMYNIGDSPTTQVPNGADLSSTILQVVAIGR